MAIRRRRFQPADRLCAGTRAELVRGQAEYSAACSGDDRDMSLVENAIAKLREAAGSANLAPPIAPQQFGRVTTLATGDPERPIFNNKVVSIDGAAMRANGYLPEMSQDRQFAEHYRQIKRPLIDRALAAQGRSAEADPRVLMITSA